MNLKITAAIIFALCASTAHAATIADGRGPSTGSFTLGNFSRDQDPLGIVFSLGASFNNIMAGGVVRDVNSFNAPEFSVTLSIYEGIGFGGTQLGSVTNVLADGFDGTTSADFSFLGTLSAGDYTLGFSSGGSGRGALVTSGEDQVVDVNEDGIIDWPNFGTRPENTDFAAFVTGDQSNMAPIPLPASALLLGFGIAGLGAASRRARR